MPSFKIRFFGPITSLTQLNEVNVHDDGCTTLRDVFTQLGKEHGETLKNKIIAPDGNFQPYLNVVVNTTNVKRLKGIDTEVKDSDGIVVALTVTGG